MKSRFFILSILTAILASCTMDNDNSLKINRKEADAMNFLYEYMSIADKADYDSLFFLSHVRTALKARREMDWGSKVPDNLFRHFVLPPRVNNERMDSFRTMYYDTLKARVAGLSMHDAALEINHWCHEKVTYTPSDARTSSPLATMLNAQGRCGEESTFTVSAMRTVGIPARQVYTPRWAHTDDNHAWVEVWVDGRWNFLGACEPEADLNMAWFNEPASRAMLMHTLVFGDYRTDEDVIRRTHSFTEINVIGNYVDTRNNVVKVIDREGNPVSGARVEFCIYNYGEFYPAVTLTTAEDGTASLHTGHGSLLVWASKDGLYGRTMIGKDDDMEDKVEAVVILSYTDDDIMAEDIDVMPPAPGMIPCDADPQLIEANKLRLEYEDSLRNAYKASFAGKCEIADAKGNWREINRFLSFADSLGKQDLALSILGTISRKDVRDTPFDVLADALVTAPSPVSGSDPDLYDEYILCPRIYGEFLRPYHDAIRNALEPELGQNPDAGSVIEWCLRNIEVADSLNPRRLQATPAGTLKVRMGDSRSWDIFTVAALRTFGIPARVDPMTTKAQYCPPGVGGWIDLHEASESGQPSAKGCFRMVYTPGAGILDNPAYYRHFSLARLEGGRRTLLEFEGGDATELGADASAKVFSKPFALDAGTYLLTSGTRMASGKVLARTVTFKVESGRTAKVPLVMRQSKEDLGVIGSMDPEMLYTTIEDGHKTSILSTTGRGYFLIMVTAASDEPGNHALRDIASISTMIADYGRPMLILTPSSKDASALVLPSGFDTFRHLLHFGIDPDGDIRKMICDGCHSASKTLPVVALCDSFGRVVYLSTGYNTSLAMELANALTTSAQVR